MAISFSKLAALNLFTFDISSGCFWQLSRSLVTGGGRRNLNHFVLQREFPWALKHVKPLWSPYPYGTSEPEVMYLELDIQDWGRLNPGFKIWFRLISVRRFNFRHAELCFLPIHWFYFPVMKWSLTLAAYFLMVVFLILLSFHFTKQERHQKMPFQSPWLKGESWVYYLIPCEDSSSFHRSCAKITLLRTSYPRDYLTLFSCQNSKLSVIFLSLIYSKLALFNTEAGRDS